MAEIKIRFGQPLNVSAQEQDILFAVLLKNGQAGTNSPHAAHHKPIAVGVITKVDPGNKVISVNTSGYNSINGLREHFLFFSKNKRVNTSGLLGYYSLAEFRNASKKEAEIFATGAEYSPSSK